MWMEYTKKWWRKLHKGRKVACFSRQAFFHWYSHGAIPEIVLPPTIHESAGWRESLLPHWENSNE